MYPLFKYSIIKYNLMTFKSFNYEYFCTIFTLILYNMDLRVHILVHVRVPMSKCVCHNFSLSHHAIKHKQTDVNERLKAKFSQSGSAFGKLNDESAPFVHEYNPTNLKCRCIAYALQQIITDNKVKLIFYLLYEYMNNTIANTPYKLVSLCAAFLYF